MRKYTGGDAGSLRRATAIPVSVYAIRHGRAGGSAIPARYNRRIRSTSLTNRIFFACTLLAAVSLGSALLYVSGRASRDVEDELRRGVIEAGSLVDENLTSLTDTFTRMARLVADLPKLKAAVATGDAPTVQPLAEEYRAQIKADVLVLTDGAGKVLGAVGATPESFPRLAHDSAHLEEVATIDVLPAGLLQVVSVPVLLQGDPPELLGRLTVGFFLDEMLAAQLKRLTGSEIAFAVDGRVVAATLPPDARAALAPLLTRPNVIDTTLNGEEFLGLIRPLEPRSHAATAPTLVVLRSRTARLQFLSTIRTGLLAALMVTVLLATIVSYAVARTVTRPVTAITQAMRDAAATGDLARAVALRSGRWDDDDARLLVSAFNALTDSVTTFQRDASQRERLSALGRLSTVVAHEIRNPLMIIKAALRSLQPDGGSTADRREAVADIAEETDRLNRIVTEVLDFARPIQFQPSETNVNEVCRASAAAAAIDDPHAAASLDLDDSIPTMMLDAERLRTVLVNVLTNARHAVQATASSVVPTGAGSPAPDTAIRLVTRRDGDRAVITVTDRGIGIDADDMPHIFDPFFTTRRTGTGLGLPIAKNIIDGMGGTMAVASQPGSGTAIRIELPLTGHEARA
jgi:signal transduction histidine kinase